MRLLLDTHVALWAITDDGRLKPAARRLILAPSTVVVVSAVSVWEIAIKYALGRGDMPVSAADALRYFSAAGYLLLGITAEHAAEVERLASIHADPFDRLLVAQALCEPMRLMTHDATVARYGDTIISV
jgi:PIN domain nuclease of toxin-antitoxin system